MQVSWLWQDWAWLSFCAGWQLLVWELCCKQSKCGGDLYTGTWWEVWWGGDRQQPLGGVDLGAQQTAVGLVGVIGWNGPEGEEVSGQGCDWWNGPVLWLCWQQLHGLLTDFTEAPGNIHSCVRGWPDVVLGNLLTGDCECTDSSGVKGLDSWAHPTIGYCLNNSEDPSGKAAILGGEDSTGNNDGENPLDPSEPFLDMVGVTVLLTGGQALSLFCPHTLSSVGALGNPIISLWCKVGSGRCGVALGGFAVRATKLPSISKDSSGTVGCTCFT